MHGVFIAFASYLQYGALAPRRWWGWTGEGGRFFGSVAVFTDAGVERKYFLVVLSNLRQRNRRLSFEIYEDALVVKHISCFAQVAQLRGPSISSVMLNI